MEKKSIIITFIIVFTFIGLLLWGYAKNGNTVASVQGVTKTGAKSELISDITINDFGTITMRNGDVSKDFTFTNPTNKDITINSVETSCMCTKALLVETDGSIKGPFGMASMGGNTTTNDIIRAGESRTLRVVYDPNAHGPAGVGQIDRFATITDSSGATLQFEIKALVTP
ncbi:MAG: DUF1573 domain-containing protein [bacterium]